MLKIFRQLARKTQRTTRVRLAALASLRPRWTAFLTILRTCGISSSAHISLYCQGPQTVLQRSAMGKDQHGFEHHHCRSEVFHLFHECVRGALCDA